MAKTPILTDLTSQYSAQATVNNNNTAIENAFLNVVSRDGSTPNQMEADFDLNSNNLLNVSTLHTKSLVVNGSSLVNLEVSIMSFPTRALAESGITGSETTIVVDGLFYQYDPLGTALTTGDARTWSPKGIATLRHFGAVGDGVTDDTVFIQRAIDFGKNLIAEDGKYRLTSQLNNISVEIQGTGYKFSNQNVTDINDLVGCIFLCDFEQISGESVFDIEQGGGLKDILIYYPNQPATRPALWTPTTTPWAITVGTVAENAYTVRDQKVHIENVMILEFTHGVRLNKGAEQGLLRRIHGNCFTKFIEADANYDTTRIELCRRWPYGGNTGSVQANELAWTINNLSGFRFGRVDGLELDGCFSYGHKNGIEFYPSESTEVGFENHATTNAHISECYLDAGDRAIWVHGTYASGWYPSFSVTNSMLFHKNDTAIVSEQANIDIDSDFGSIRIVNSEIQSGGFARTGSPITVNAATGHLLIDGCDITTWDDANTGAKLVDKLGNAKVTITEDCTYRGNAGNTFEPSNGLINGDDIGDTAFGGLMGPGRVEYPVESGTGFADYVRSDAATNAGWNIRLKRSRGTLRSKTAVQSADSLGALNFLGWDGNSFSNGAFIEGVVNGAVSDGNVPSEMQFGVWSGGAFVDAAQVRGGGLLSLQKPVSISFTDRAAIITWLASNTPTVGTVLWAGEIGWYYDGTSTNISDMSGYIPFGTATPDHFGSNTTPGTTDMTTAFQAAITYVQSLGGGTVRLAETTYAITSVSITQNDVKIIGAGEGLSILDITTAAAVGIDVGTFKQNTLLRDFTITRSVTATAGGYNIRFQQNVNRARIERVTIKKGYNGLHLRNTAYSNLSNVVVEECINHGIVIKGDGASGAHQWNMDEVLSQKNGGDGVYVEATAGFAQMIVGEMRGLKTALNTGYGFRAVGLATCKIQDIRLKSGFFGSDGNDEIYLDTYGNSHLIENCFVEQAGRTVTGPSLTTPASGIGSGIKTTANNRDITITGGGASANSQHGQDLAGDYVVTSMNSWNNGQAAGTFAGINSTANVIVVSGVISTNTAGVSQDYGFQGDDGSKARLDGDFRGNGTGDVLFATNSSQAIVVGSRGLYATGTVTATTSAAGEITFAHGLSGIPDWIDIMPNAIGDAAAEDYQITPTAVDATNITVVVRDSGVDVASTSVSLYWQARTA